MNHIQKRINACIQSGGIILDLSELGLTSIPNNLPDKLNLKSVYVEVYEQSNFYMDNVALTMD